MKITFKLFLPVICCLFAVFLHSQNYDVPHDSIVKKLQIKRIKVYEHFPIKADSNNLEKGELLSKYKYNPKGQLIREKQINVSYTYYYRDSLIMIQDKWKIFTNRWIEGIPYSCTCIYNDTIHNYTVVTQYDGKCKEKNINKGTLHVSRIYRDSIGRDTLNMVISNKWYYASDTTGYTKNKYYYSEKNLIVWTRTSNYTTYKNEEIKHIRINSKNQPVEIYKPGYNSTCPRERFEYTNDLITRKIHYNCIDIIHSIELYKYKYYKRKNKRASRAGKKPG